MADEINLKSKNIPYLWFIFIANVIVLISLFFAANVAAIRQDINVLFSEKIIMPLAASLILFVINGLIPANWKAVLVFWRFKDALPGHRAFSIYGHEDPRVNMSTIASKHGPLPSDAKEQNRLWYKIYKLNKTELSVATAHKNFLRARDIVNIVVIFIIVAGLPALVIGKWPYNCYYFLLLIGQYIVFAYVGQNYGKRFVTNVLAIEGSK